MFHNELLESGEAQFVVFDGVHVESTYHGRIQPTSMISLNVDLGRDAQEHTFM